MTPGARIEASIELLGLIAATDQAPDQVIDGYFRKRRYAGSGDRRDIFDRVFSVLRHRAKLDWWTSRTGSTLAKNARTQTLAHLVLEERTSPDQIAACFSGARHAPEHLDFAEEELLGALYGRPLLHREMPDHVRYEYPEWMDRSFRSLWSDSIGEEMAALNQPAPVDLRVNTLKATPEDALQALRDDFVECAPTAISPIGIRVSGRVRLGGKRAFKEGWVEVQDEGSQLVSLLVGARPGMIVMDLCAGAGGKTLALAASMGEQGRVMGHLHALDVSKYRLDRLDPRARRAAAGAIRRRVISAGDDTWIDGMNGKADRVLADVPCTGTGSWRRNPDARWRFEPDDLDTFVGTQRQILARGATLVKPGGRLIYVTCSLLQEENEQQLDWFLKQRQDYELLPIQNVWRETIGGAGQHDSPVLRLSPATTGTDGFFCAVMSRMK